MMFHLKPYANSIRCLTGASSNFGHLPRAQPSLADQSCSSGYSCYLLVYQLWKESRLVYIATPPPKSSSSHSPWDLSSWFPQDQQTKNQFWNRHGSTPLQLHTGFSMGEAGKNSHILLFPWKGFGCILSQLLPEVWFPISLLLGPEDSFPFQEINESPYTLSYWEPLRRKTVA